MGAIAKAKKAIGSKLVEWGIRLNYGYFHAKVIEVSKIASIDFTKNLIKSKGYMVCEAHRCLRQTSLRKFEGKMYCVPHFQILNAELNRQLLGAIK